MKIRTVLVAVSQGTGRVEFIERPAYSDPAAALVVARAGGQRVAYEVIHRVSGQSICPSLRTIAKAKAVIAAVLPLTDWTRGPVEIAQERGLHARCREAAKDVSS